jgi:imidazolonepropionase
LSAPKVGQEGTSSKPAIVLLNIRQLVTLRAPEATLRPRRGGELKELGIIENGAVLCAGGKLISVGTTRQALRDSWFRKTRKNILEIDCAGKVAFPGFVDSHTHPAFVSPRLDDFEKRITGATYEQIAEQGGGIRSSIEAVRAAAKSELAQRIVAAFHEMLAHGTTAVEAKSGYGLSSETELKSLRAIRLAASRWPGTVVSTFLGAHAVPADYLDRPQQYLRLVCEEMIPQVAEKKLARFVDVFCDRGAFSEEDSLKIFAAAQRRGFGLRAHISQLVRTSLAKLLSFNPASLDHLDHVNEADISDLVKGQTVATLLPGANYFLGLRQYPSARKLIDAGVAVALATDFNPGSSPTPSLPFVMSLACTHMRMSPAEAIAAATFNGACALRVQDRKGSIEPGKDADIAIFDIRDYREIGYWVAANRCEMVLANGELTIPPRGVTSSRR